MPNRYPDRFVQLLHETEGLTLDCGSGVRSYPGVVSLEYTRSAEIDIQGDGLNLPFRDGSFTLVLSQAVIEHVTDPQAYVDEIHRVLKPGGLAYFEAAFIQPIHMPPMHYFNITPHGLAHLCRGFEVLETGTIGWFAETIAWLCRESGVPVPSVSEPPDHLRHCAASGVSLLGRKP